MVIMGKLIALEMQISEGDVSLSLFIRDVSQLFKDSEIMVICVQRGFKAAFFWFNGCLACQRMSRRYRS